MRALFAIALIIAGSVAALFAGAVPAGAHESRHYSASHRRAAEIVLCDYEPGVIVRSYWRAPWRNHHYFPRTGKRPAIGRDEDLSLGGRDLPERAETFERSWSNSQAFPPVRANEEPAADERPIEQPREPEADKFQRIPPERVRP